MLVDRWHRYTILIDGERVGRSLTARRSRYRFQQAVTP
jgi:hypothetical protein